MKKLENIVYRTVSTSSAQSVSSGYIEKASAGASRSA